MSSAEMYDIVQRNHQGKDGLDLIAKLTLRSGSCVLDLGCGTGFLTGVLAAKVGPEGKIIGVDPNREKINIAQRKYTANGALFLHGSSENFPSGPYDVIFSNYVLQWIEDKETTFEKVYSNLKVGGEFAFVVHGPRSNHAFVLEPITQKVYSCSTDVYNGIAFRIGFEVGFQSVESMKYSFSNADAFIDWICATYGVSLDANTRAGCKKSFDADPYLRFDRLMFVFKK